MSDREQLKAQKRTVLGKKVGALRRNGILPGTVYGNKTTPESIQMNARNFRDVVHQSGTTQLIDLLIDDEQPRTVLIRQLGKDVKRNTVNHVEFFQPDLQVKLRTHVPLVFVGESAAVKLGGIFLPVLDTVDIESLPESVPAGGLEVDLAQLVEVNMAVHASDLQIPPGVTLMTALDEVLARVNAPTVAAPTEEAGEAPVEETAETPEEA